MVRLLYGEKRLRLFFNRFDRIPACECDRRSDGRTDRRLVVLPHHSPRCAYASRGKNEQECVGRHCWHHFVDATVKQVTLLTLSLATRVGQPADVHSVLPQPWVYPRLTVGRQIPPRVNPRLPVKGLKEAKCLRPKPRPEPCSRDWGRRQI